MLPARDKLSIIVAMTVSVVVHTILFAILSLAPGRPPEDEAFAVMLVEPQLRQLANRLEQKKSEIPPEPVKQTPKQFVSPSQAPEQPPPPETTRLSERDSVTAKEQIKRGHAPSAPPPQTPAQAPTSPSASTPTPPKVERSLRLGGGEILSKLGSGINEPSESASSVANQQAKLSEKRLSELENGSVNSKSQPNLSIKRLDNYAPFNRTSVRNLFTGPSGSPDYLPELPDGDITLLNAKANAYAVFVRRVALQVFSALRSQSWASLPFNEIQKLREFAVIEAVMDKNGKLARIRVQDSSGSIVFDQVVQAAANKGTWDQNPPAGAALEDGNIHFAFHARTWARPPIDNRGEQRWLLLGTELK